MTQGSRIIVGARGCRLMVRARGCRIIVGGQGLHDNGECKGYRIMVVGLIGV